MPAAKVGANLAIRVRGREARTSALPGILAPSAQNCRNLSTYSVTAPVYPRRVSRTPAHAHTLPAQGSELRLSQQDPFSSSIVPRPLFAESTGHDSPTAQLL